MHPTICHRDEEAIKTKRPEVHREEEATMSPVSLNSHMGAGKDNEVEECTMAIVPVIVRMKNGLKYVRTHAFLNPGSNVTFISQDIARQLGAQGTKMSTTLNTMGNPYNMDTYAIQGLQISNLDSEETIKLPKTFTKDKIPVSTNLMPTEDDVSRWPHLDGMSIPKLDASVGLLLGNNVPDAYAPLEVKSGPRGSPHAVRSRIGWILWNVLRNKNQNSNRTMFVVNRAEIKQVNEVLELKQLDTLVRHSFDVDFPERAFEEKKEHSQNDIRFLQKVNDSMQLVNGHYHIELPFREETVNLPDNRVQAERRLASLQRKLRRDPHLYDSYTKFMVDLVNKGHAEEVPDNEINRKDGYVWYLPHHNVVYPKKAEKVRIVFDCTTTYNDISLYSQLLQGPDLTNYLIGVLLRFRIGKVAIMADIEAMFHQVYVTKKHTDCLRYLWWDNGNMNDKNKVYRMLVHLFGATSSPSRANAAWKQTGIDNKHKFGQAVTDVLLNSFYVDDCLVSTDTAAEASKLIKDITYLCSLGGFHLTKRTRSSTEVLQTVPVQERPKNIKPVVLDTQNLPVERALGIQWLLDSDTLGFSVSGKSYSATRRGILSAVSSVYDPLGIASPFVLVAKIVLQKLWGDNMEWDTPISEAESRRWSSWLKELPLLVNLQLRRCYKSDDFGEVTSTQLHYFSDASDKGYCVACYIRQPDNTGRMCWQNQE